MEKFLLKAVLYRQAAGFHWLNDCAELKPEERNDAEDTAQRS